MVEVEDVKVDYTINSKLFAGIEEKALKDYLKKSNTFIKTFKPGSYVFQEGDPCNYFFLLLDGMVQVERMSSKGKRVLVNRFQNKGTIFGEVYVYLKGRDYDYSCLSPSGAEILFLSKEVLEPGRGPVGEKLCENMLVILSNKAFFLNQKLLVQGAGGLKQKLAMYLLQLGGDKGEVKLSLNREELADYLGVARPSLSRQLMRMEKEEIIQVDRNKIIYSVEKLEDLAF